MCKVLDHVDIIRDLSRNYCSQFHPIRRSATVISKVKLNEKRQWSNYKLDLWATDGRQLLDEVNNTEL